MLKASLCVHKDAQKKPDDHLLIQEDLPLEVRPEVLDFGADIFLHHSVQRDPELIQLGLERGQLCSLLQMNPFPASSYCLFNVVVKALLAFNSE